jgi:hypothetical protein
VRLLRARHKSEVGWALASSLWREPTHGTESREKEVKSALKRKIKLGWFPLPLAEAERIRNSWCFLHRPSRQWTLALESAELSPASPPERRDTRGWCGRRPRRKPGSFRHRKLGPQQWNCPAPRCSKPVPVPPPNFCECAVAPPRPPTVLNNDRPHQRRFHQGKVTRNSALDHETEFVFRETGKHGNSCENFALG